jgi:hypothetical protein
MIEIGAKTIMRQVNSDYSYQVAGATGSFAADARNPEGFLELQSKHRIRVYVLYVLYGQQIHFQNRVTLRIHHD